MNLLSFDLGASSGKLCLTRFDGAQAHIQIIHRFDNRSHILHESLFWDIHKIVDELYEGIGKAVELTGDRIHSFGADTFCNDYALLGENGELLSPVHCYRDQRTARCAEEIYKIMPKQELHQITGNQNALFNTLMQLAAMRLSGTGFLLDQCHCLLFLPDYLTWLLTGKAVAEFSVSSVSQMFDYRARDWSPAILKAYGIPPNILAPCIMPGTVLGHTTEAFNRRLKTKGFSVSAVCEHDTASAFLTSRVLVEKHVTISCGTWALIGTEQGAPVVREETLRQNFANEGGYGGIYRLSHNVMGLWVLQEAKRSLDARGVSHTYDELDRLCLQAPPFSFLIDVDSQRFYKPRDMLEEIRSCCMEQYGRAPESPGEIVRCIYESLALRFSFYIRQLESLTGERFGVIHMVGGGAMAGPLCQFTADACQKSVAAGPADATAIGNTAAQMCAQTAIADPVEALAAFTMSTKDYFPRKDARWDCAMRQILIQ